MNCKNDCKEHKVCDVDIDCAKCKPKRPKENEILLECGDGTGSRTFTSSEDAPFQLAHVTLNESNLKVSEVAIKFSSLIKIELVGSPVVRLQYELFKSCDGKLPLSLGSWMFEKDFAGVVLFESIEESFNFTFCECQTLNDCCDYFVTVKPIEILGDPAVTVSNGRIAALTQALCDEPKMKGKEDLKKNRVLESDKILLSCGKGTSAGQTVFQNLSLDQPATNLAQVTIDTACLKKSKVLIEFSSIIEICNLTFENIVLQFELFRVCGDSEPISCGIWTFEEAIDGSTSVQITQEQIPFSFIFCECLNISECCIYFVKVTPLQALISLQISPPLATWKICNAQINAYAQSSSEGDLQYNIHKISKEKDDCDLCNKVHPKPKKILLECGSGTGSRTFNSLSDSMAFQLANVTIDTSCLCKPVVNIEFSSTLSFETEAGDQSSVGQLRYELFRSCDGGVPISVGVWMVDRIPLLIRNSVETFNFTYCDCITCPGCCDYFVTAKPILLSDQTFVLNATITVGNGSIVALAQEG